MFSGNLDKLETGIPGRGARIKTLAFPFLKLLPLLRECLSLREKERRCGVGGGRGEQTKEESFQQAEKRELPVAVFPQTSAGQILRSADFL